MSGPGSKGHVSTDRLNNSDGGLMRCDSIFISPLQLYLWPGHKLWV